ncbi:hypothetical protein K2X33_00260, partial [bacterium]|nr:hypothetical protein [bacterium]
MKNAFFFLVALSFTVQAAKIHTPATPTSTGNRGVAAEPGCVSSPALAWVKGALKTRSGKDSSSDLVGQLAKTPEGIMLGAQSEGTDFMHLASRLWDLAKNENQSLLVLTAQLLRPENGLGEQEAESLTSGLFEYLEKNNIKQDFSLKFRAAANALAAAGDGKKGEEAEKAVDAALDGVIKALGKDEPITLAWLLFKSPDFKPKQYMLVQKALQKKMEEAATAAIEKDLDPLVAKPVLEKDGAKDSTELKANKKKRNDFAVEARRKQINALASKLRELQKLKGTKDGAKQMATAAKEAYKLAQNLKIGFTLPELLSQKPEDVCYFGGSRDRLLAFESAIDSAVTTGVNDRFAELGSSKVVAKAGSDLRQAIADFQTTRDPSKETDALERIVGPMRKAGLPDHQILSALEGIDGFQLTPSKRAALEKYLNTQSGFKPMTAQLEGKRGVVSKDVQDAIQALKTAKPEQVKERLDALYKAA